jgi:hypothetical protein
VICDYTIRPLNKYKWRIIVFFTNTKNAKKENSIVLEVRKNIAIHKESLEVWKEKLKEIKKINQE